MRYQVRVKKEARGRLGGGKKDLLLPPRRKPENKRREKSSGRSRVLWGGGGNNNETFNFGGSTLHSVIKSKERAQGGVEVYFKALGKAKKKEGV